MAAPEIPASPATPQPIEVFCSYSHKDEALREELDTHLNILQHNGVITNWVDHAIPAGKQWADEIDEHLNSAQIILLLISPDFLASQYCREVEVKRAMERHAAGEARVISIMLRDVDWHGSPLSKLQALPKNAKAVTQWADRDQAFKDIAIGIRKVAEDLRKPGRQKRTAGGTELTDSSSSTATETIRRPPVITEKGPWKKYAAVGALAVLLLAGLGYYGLRGSLGKHAKVADCTGNSSCGDLLASVPGGDYFGAIDVGSKGTKAALFTFRKRRSTGLDAQVIYKRPINTTLVSSMKGDQFTDNGVRDATEAVKELLGEIHAAADKDKVKVIGYYVVGSSGVAKAKNKDALVAAVKAATGIDMDFVDAKREGYFGLISAVPTTARGNSLYLDIGSGNTKLGCEIGGTDLASYHSEEIDYGSVTGRNRGLEKNPNDIWAGIQQLMQDEVKPTYQEESMNTPCLRSRDAIFWTGGAAWATATFMHPGAALDGYVTISKQDLESFLSRLSDGSWSTRPFEYAFAKDVPQARQDAIRDQAEKDKESVMNVFVREDLLSGVSIMKTVLQFSAPTASLQFVRNSNYLYGYALAKYQQEGGDSEAEKK
ncbi:MAG TPA: TIR domain-containing protein [Terriglobales bacterium]|nr:TIR domain-containing protein [Terriglobales bacterium]